MISLMISFFFFFYLRFHKDDFQVRQQYCVRERHTVHRVETHRTAASHRVLSQEESPIHVSNDKTLHPGKRKRKTGKLGYVSIDGGNTKRTMIITKT